MNRGDERRGTQRAPAIGRSARVLELLAHDGPVPWSRVGPAIGLAKSSTSDLLTSLAASRWVRRAESGFMLGGLLPELCAGFVGTDIDLVQFGLEWAADPVLHEHTVSVQVIQGVEIFCLEVRIGRHVLPLTPRPGSRVQGWHGDRGEPALAVLSEPVLRSTLNCFAGFQGLTSSTRESILEWAAAERSEIGGPQIQRAVNGNDELSLPCPGDRAVLLTAHLPPDAPPANLPDLHQALSTLSTLAG